MKDIQITKSKGKTATAVPLTEAAKKVFKKEKYPNGFVVPADEVHKILSWAVSHNLSVDSTVPIVIPQRPFLTRDQLSVMQPNVPKSFLPAKLFAMGMAVFKGDILPQAWSVNDKFTKGVEYPIYEDEGVTFVVNEKGEGFKFVASAWTQIKGY